MKKIINYLAENPTIVKLLLENKVSLIGINNIEKKSIIESYKENISPKSGFWS